MIHLLLVDEQRANTRILRAFLQEQTDINVIGQALTAADARYQCRFSNVVLVNISCSRLQPLPLVRELARSAHGAKVLVLSQKEDPALILQYIEAGATGYLLEHESNERCLQKVRAACNGEAIVSPRIACRLLNRLYELERLTRTISVGRLEMWRLHRLTGREMEVLGLVEKELSNGEIALQLNITEGTVKNHVHRVLRKLDVHSRYEAAALYRLWSVRRHQGEQV